MILRGQDGGGGGGGGNGGGGGGGSSALDNSIQDPTTPTRARSCATDNEIAFRAMTRRRGESRCPRARIRANAIESH